MAKRTGIQLASADGGLMRWKLGDGSLVELNTAKCSAEVRRNAEIAGFHRAISNIGAGRDKADWSAIRLEMQRRIRGMLAGQWKVNVGGYGFADHVEAIVRLAQRHGKQATHEEISDRLLAWTPEQRSAHAATPHVRLLMQEIATERMRLAAAESEDELGDALDGLI